MNGKTVLITGGNNGFGYVTSENLLKMGADVVLVCRNLERGELAQTQLEAATGRRPDFIIGDLMFQVDVKRVAAEFRAKYDRLDVLINNAGTLFMSREETEEGFERTFALNYLAYFTLTMELIDMLIASAPSRIVNTASRAHASQEMSMGNLQGEVLYKKWFSPFPQMYGYTNIYRIMFTYELAERLAEKGVTANTYCPGFVAVERSTQSRFMKGLSKMMRQMGAGRTPEEAAGTILFLATDPEAAALNGTYHDSGVLSRSSEQTYNTILRQHVWNKTVELTGYAADPLPRR